MAESGMPEKTNHTTTEQTGLLLDAGAAPVLPGCYLMRDAENRILYIGKAKSLRARIRNYINATDSRYSVKFLMRRVASIEYFTVGSEKEALLLENTLIKTHKPRYNVRLRDDKTFISIRLNPAEPYPRLTVVRRRREDGARYFGPYHDTRAARKTIRQLQRLVPLRVCSDHVLENRARPCIYYQMKQCHAPCVGFISRESYGELVSQALLILEGRSDELENRLREEMLYHADAMRFEQAALVRDRLADLKTTVEPQRAVMTGRTHDRDVFGYYQEGRFIQIQVLYYRNHAMVGGKTFGFDHVEAPVDELIGSFLLQYYDSVPAIPQEILLPLDLEDGPALAEVLGEKRGSTVHVRVPRRGALAGLVQLAASNAQRAFTERKGHERALEETLEAVRKTLHLGAVPHRIECFDVSTIQGDSTVAAMVVFEQGQSAKQRYRRYSIKRFDGQDDFAAMREALERRYARALREQDLPDLVLIDGGKGHLNVAKTVLNGLDLGALACASIAKSRGGTGETSFERFFIPGRSNPIVPPQNGPVVKLLASIRDEAHRFAITYHRKKRSAARLSTELLAIPGIGKSRARLLLTTFGSVARVRQATVEQLAAIPSISATLALKIKHALGPE